MQTFFVCFRPFILALNASMQALIDRPERLSSASVRQQAQALLDTANQQSPSGPVLRSQIARLGLLMPDYEGAVKTSSVQTGSATTGATTPRSGSVIRFAISTVWRMSFATTWIGASATNQDLQIVGIASSAARRGVA